MTATIVVGDDYEVRIGRGLLAQVADALPQDAAQVLVVHPPTVARAARLVADGARSRGLQVRVAELPDAEAAKTVEVAARLWSLMAQHAFTRSDLVVGVGGGSATDLAGFVAATFLRGITVVQVPTSLLGMVDAAVGGKTGINIAEGKNLVGSFHPPHSVWCDLDVLDTLAPADLVAGMAEAVKCGFIRDPQILRLVEADPQAALDVRGPVLPQLVRRAVQVKADVVARDLREASLREILNYGHTFAHAIEQVEHYEWRHGDAVAVGMVYAAQLARAAGLIDEPLLRRHLSVLTSLGLPVSYRGDWDALLTAMHRDKKARGSRLRFVALDGRVGATTRIEAPGQAALRSAYDRLG